MPTITDYLNNLKTDKNNLVTNLNTKGIAAENTETFTQLVPKVLEIDTSGLDTSDATAVATDIKTGKTAYVNGEKITGTYEELDTSDATATPADIKNGLTAYANGEKITGTAYTRGAVTAVVDGTQHWLKEGFYTGGITIPGDEDLIPANVKKGVEIYGVTGTLEASSSSLDTSDATAAASDILDGKTAYVNGEKITGIILSQEEQIITPTTTDQIITSGVYLAGNQTIQGDTNLLAGNIKSGVTIFGVTGTYSGPGGGSKSEGTLINTSAFTSAQQTLDTYGQSIYISESTDERGLLPLSTLVEKWGGPEAQNGYIANADGKYGISIANWSENSGDTAILFMTPMTTVAETLLLRFNCNLSGWLTANLTMNFIEAVGDTEAEILQGIKDKISAEDYAYTKPISYLGSSSGVDVLMEVDSAPIGTYYVYITGTKKGDGTGFTYINIHYLSF